MEIRAFLNDDGTAVLSFGEPGQMTGVEVEWHTAELRLTAADGSLVRSITCTSGGQTVVGGPDAAPATGATASGTAEVEAQHAPEPSGEKPAEAEASATGFAAMSQHADEVKP